MCCDWKLILLIPELISILHLLFYLLALIFLIILISKVTYVLIKMYTEDSYNLFQLYIPNM